MKFNKSVPGRTTFVPVSLKGGQCSGDHLHFRGAAKEVYSYMKLLAAKSKASLVYASLENISSRTKNWKTKNKRKYTVRHCKRIIHMFRELGVLGKYGSREIEGRTRRGWPFVGHAFWAEAQGDLCEFRRWVQYEDSFQGDRQQNVPGNVPAFVLGDVPDIEQNVPLNVPRTGDAIVDKALEREELKIEVGR